jgi:hypothetical protein
MDLLEGGFLAASLLIIVATLLLFVRFNTSQQKGERLTIKYRDMDPITKTATALIVTLICFNLYLAIGDMLSVLNVAVLPFSWIYSLARPTPILGVTTTMVGLAVFFRLKFPRRPSAA